jgi:DNA polymerase-1
LQGPDTITPGSLPTCDKSDRSDQSPPPPYLLVSDPAGLPAVVAALDNTALVGLDTETTGLDPRADRIRLLSLAVDTIDGGRFTYLLDCFAVDPSPLWESLAEKELVSHNAAFDLLFLARMGFTPCAKVHDTMPLARLLVAGTPDRCRL